MEMVRMTPDAAEAAALVHDLMRALPHGLRWVAGVAGGRLERAGGALRQWAQEGESAEVAISKRARTRGP